MVRWIHNAAELFSKLPWHGLPAHESRPRWPCHFVLQRVLLVLALVFVGLRGVAFNVVAAAETQRPNILFVLCDDLGYGDVRCCNPNGKIATPNMDRLALEGMLFIDAHTSSAVCTPTRYGLMTGRYNWRSKLQSGVLGGLSPRLIEPGRVKAGSTTDQLVCLTDFLATAADIADAKLPANAGEDSVSFLPTLLGQAGKSARETLVSHSINGSFAIREGSWKLCLCPGSGGWSAPRPGQKDADLPAVQLFNMRDDIGEQTNLQDSQPETVARLTKLLEKYVAEGRSTPGETQKNAVSVRIRK